MFVSDAYTTRLVSRWAPPPPSAKAPDASRKEVLADSCDWAATLRLRQSSVANATEAAPRACVIEWIWPVSLRIVFDGGSGMLAGGTAGEESTWRG
jgi:hypothetical protein